MSFVEVRPSFASHAYPEYLHTIASQLFPCASNRSIATWLIGVVGRDWDWPINSGLALEFLRGVCDQSIFEMMVIHVDSSCIFVLPTG